MKLERWRLYGAGRLYMERVVPAGTWWLISDLFPRLPVGWAYVVRRVDESQSVALVRCVDLERRPCIVCRHPAAAHPLPDSPGWTDPETTCRLCTCPERMP